MEKYRLISDGTDTSHAEMIDREATSRIDIEQPFDDDGLVATRTLYRLYETWWYQVGDLPRRWVIKFPWDHLPARLVIHIRERRSIAQQDRERLNSLISSYPLTPDECIKGGIKRTDMKWGGDLRPGEANGEGWRVGEWFGTKIGALNYYLVEVRGWSDRPILVDDTVVIGGDRFVGLVKWVQGRVMLIVPVDTSKTLRAEIGDAITPFSRAVAKATAEAGVEPDAGEREALKMKHTIAICQRLLPKEVFEHVTNTAKGLAELNLKP